MPPDTKHIKSSIAKSFTPDMVKKETVILRKTEDFWGLNETKVSAEKNKLLKNAWSRARINKFVGVTEGENIFLSKCLVSKTNISRNRRVACLGVTLACNCSAVTDFKYSLTGKDAAGLLKPSVASQSPCRPMERKMARGLPTYESTVLLDKRKGHLQG